MNSLSVDPNDERWKDKIADWEDGQEYDVTLHVTQTAAGEFDVTALDETETPAEEAAPTEEPDKKKVPAAIAVLVGGKK